MFLRIVKAAGGKGVQHEYVRLVESYRQGGKVKQRLIASLGRKELLLEHLDALNRLLRGEKPAPTSEAGHHEAVALQAWDWGVSLVAGALWRELGLEQILDRRRQGPAGLERGVGRPGTGAGRQPTGGARQRARLGRLAGDQLRL